MKFILHFFILILIFFNKIEAQTISPVITTGTSPGSTVELVEFTALIKKDKVILTWIVNAEKNNKEFIIYRSVDEANYYVVVNQTGRMNGIYQKKYEAVDNTASGGINHYKLAYRDVDEKITELKIVKIDMEDKSKAITVTPDKITSQLKINSAEPINTIQLELSDVLGRIYDTPFVVDGTHDITAVTGGLKPGVYYLNCYLNKSRTVMKKILID